MTHGEMVLDGDQKVWVTKCFSYRCAPTKIVDKIEEEVQGIITTIIVVNIWKSNEDIREDIFSLKSTKVYHGCQDSRLNQK